MRAHMISRTQWIKGLRARLDVTQSEFAQMLNTTQPSVARWERGSDPQIDNWKSLEALARDHNYNLMDAESPDTVPLVGYVSAGASVILHSLGQGPFDEVERPFNSTPHTVAVAVRGDSMTGLADNDWLIYYDDRREEPNESLFNKLCVVELIDGTVLVKKLLPGRKPRLYDLYSSNGPPILDQHVNWAAPVAWIKPR